MAWQQRTSAADSMLMSWGGLAGFSENDEKMRSENLRKPCFIVFINVIHVYNPSILLRQPTRGFQSRLDVGSGTSQLNKTCVKTASNSKDCLHTSIIGSL